MPGTDSPKFFLGALRYNKTKNVVIFECWYLTTVITYQLQFSQVADATISFSKKYAEISSCLV